MQENQKIVDTYYNKEIEKKTKNKKDIYFFYPNKKKYLYLFF